jgi:hypothetical protein
MRTTIDLNDKLFRALKRQAAQDGVTMKAILEAALRRYLQPSTRRNRYKLHWQTERGVLQTGVVIEDRNILYDVMEDIR